MTRPNGARAAAKGPRTNGLMIAFAFTLPYHVMRTAAAAGVRVHVLGHGASRGLRMSRSCRSYRLSRFVDDPEILLDEIREIVTRERVDVIFPSDDVSTRLLGALRDRLPVRSTPIPSLPVFDLLNDKWNFTQFCMQNGVRVPEGRLFDNVAGLRRSLVSGELLLPITLKPTNRSGGFGVVHLRDSGDLAVLDAIDYTPILVQRHINGETIGISVLCDHGQVLAHATQRRDEARFQLFADADLLANVTRLAALTGYSGPANFDAVLSDDDGLAYIVECNPRFWYTIYLSMIAGLNFFSLALANPRPDAGEPVTLAGSEIALSWRNTLIRPWRAGRLDWKFVAYNLGDPLAYLLQRAKSYDDSDVAVPVGDMTACTATIGADIPVADSGVRPSFTAEPHSVQPMGAH
jgi:biotin carboxylase